MTTGLVQLTDVDVVRRFTVTEAFAGPLPVWFVSPAYDAETLIVPVVLPVKLAEHVAVAPLPLSVQLVLVGVTPAPLAVRLTLPDGVLAVPVGDVSLTVTVHVLAWPMT